MISKISKLLSEYVLSPVGNLFFPPVCCICDQLLPSDKKIICSNCWESIPTFSHPENQSLENKYFNDVYILFDYDHTIRKLVHLLKYDMYLTLAKYFAEKAFQAFPMLIKNNYSMIVPVPLHRIRFRERGFNQSTEISNYIGMLLNVPVNEKILKRIRNTPSQTGLNKVQRKNNVLNAFTCTSELINNKILLIDDVMTTGSTLESCAKVLLEAGANTVDIFCVASPLIAHELEDNYL